MLMIALGCISLAAHAAHSFQITDRSILNHIAGESARLYNTPLVYFLPRLDHRYVSRITKTQFSLFEGDSLHR